MAKYTKFCSATILKQLIQSNPKNQHAMHILVIVFKKHLSWIQKQYDREVLFAAFNKLQLRKGQINEDLSWIFVVQGILYYHQMPFGMSQQIKFNHYQRNHLRFDKQSTYVVLTLASIKQLQDINQQLQRQRLHKFIKMNIFYPHYIEQNDLVQFGKLIRFKRLGFNQRLSWKDQDGSHKLGIVYKGVMAIQYQWKRLIKLIEITKGMFLTNKYIKDDFEQMQEYALEPLQQKIVDPFPEFRYISKSENTILIIFNLRLLQEHPYNINPDLKPIVKAKYEQIVQKLQGIINFEVQNKSYRNKKSLKQQIKLKKIKENISKTVSNIPQSTSSPILQTYRTIEQQDDRLRMKTISYSNLFESKSGKKTPMSSRITYKKAAFSTMQVYSPEPKQRQKATSLKSIRRIIHNTWVQSKNKKPKHTSSFSTIKNINPITHHTRSVTVQQQPYNKQKQHGRAGNLFVAQQFVKRTLRIKYQGLINKIRNIDLSPNKVKQQTLNDKMKHLEDYIDSKMIVKLNNRKAQQKLLRNRMIT